MQWTDRVPAGTASPALAPASPLSPCGAGRGRKDLAEGGPRGPGIAPEWRAFGRPVPAPTLCGLLPVRPSFGFPCGLGTGAGPLWPPGLGSLLRATPSAWWPRLWEVVIPRRGPLSPVGPLPQAASPGRPLVPDSPSPELPRPLALRERPPTPTKRGRSRSRARPLDFLCLGVHFAFPDTAVKEAQQPRLSEAF